MVAQENVTLLTIFDNRGSCDGEFYQPHSIAIDLNDTKFLTDEKIQRYKSLLITGITSILILDLYLIRTFFVPYLETR